MYRTTHSMTTKSQSTKSADHQCLRRQSSRAGGEDNDPDHGPGHPNGGHGQTDPVLESLQRIAPVIGRAVSVTHLADLAVPLGGLAFEAGPLDLLQPVDPLQGGRGLGWSFRTVHHVRKLPGGAVTR